MANANSRQLSDPCAGDAALNSFAEKFSHLNVQTALIRSAMFIGRGLNFDENHALQVTMLSQIIFDATTTLHGLAAGDRQILIIGAMLHDIGTCAGMRGHHKNSCSLIMKSAIPGISHEDMLLAALVARYHRKSEPKEKHEFYSHLSDSDKNRVSALAAILRIADVLDRNHLQQVGEFTLDSDTKTVTFLLPGSIRSGIDLPAFEKKSRLFTKVFGRMVKIC
ncbi:MAG: hypothetical protein CVV42_18710 [Candidatus Riflebacteria bacterium HGW-Riflebacteria-2]|nr:MAG: hypothetical protein CVV42_18710 [Candidatus Riflebacteria bacterium HGW-Riflebacteria-2]